MYCIIVQRYGKYKKDSDSIKVITGSENITNFMLQSYRRAKAKMDTCYDLTGPSIISTDK